MSLFSVTYRPIYQAQTFARLCERRQANLPTSDPCDIMDATYQDWLEMVEDATTLTGPSATGVQIFGDCSIIRL